MERDQDTTAVTVREMLDSTLETVAHIEAVAVEIARRVGFRGVSLDHISLATHETITNAVVHGNRYRTEKKVFVAISITQDRFKITIADEGDGFDPMTLPDPLAPERLSEGSGRGVYLSRASMDEYHVRSRDAGGAEVTLVKYLCPQVSNPSARKS
jgi:serine/threonine-protein kinase RsbW